MKIADFLRIATKAVTANTHAITLSSITALSGKFGIYYKGIVTLEDGETTIMFNGVNLDTKATNVECRLLVENKNDKEYYTIFGWPSTINLMQVEE